MRRNKELEIIVDVVERRKRDRERKKRQKEQMIRKRYEGMPQTGGRDDVGEGSGVGEVGLGEFGMGEVGMEEGEGEGETKKSRREELDELGEEVLAVISRLGVLSWKLRLAIGARKMLPKAMAILLIAAGIMITVNIIWTYIPLTYVLPAAAFSVLTEDETDETDTTDTGVSLNENEERVGGYGGYEGEPLLGNWDNAVWPVPHSREINSRYGPRPRPCPNCSNFHRGIDIRGNGINGKEIVSVMDGKVVDSRYSSSYGYVVEIEHNSEIKTLYAHMIKKGIEKGKSVRAGDVIGYVGSTGNSTGPHLHFEIWEKQNGVFVRVDPEKYLKYLK